MARTGAAPRTLSYPEARAAVRALAARLDPEQVPLAEAAGRALATEIRAPHRLPPFDNSAMDGFAVRFDDLAQGARELPVAFTLPAGSAPGAPLDAGSAARIMTGAPLPEGADSIVPVEQSEAVGADRVRLSPPAARGAHVRRAGADLDAGAIALEAGRTLGPHDVALLAALGVARVPVTRRPRVAVISTGDELLPAHLALRPGSIRDSNLPMLKALLLECGAEVAWGESVGDAPEPVAAALSRAFAGADAALTIGGVSEGDFDPVRDVLASFPGLELWRVGMRPGRPQASGRVGGCLFHGFPGSPASVAVSFEALVRPALRRMGGHADEERPRLSARAAVRIESRRGRTDFVRVILESAAEGWRARPAGDQISGHLSPQSRAHGLLVVPEGAERVEAGEPAAVMVWRWPRAEG